MNGLFRKMSVFLLVMAVVAAAGWYGRKAYKRTTERRAVNEAVEYLKKSDGRKAVLCLQRALQVNSQSLPATRLMADMLDAAGASSALSWRIRTAQLEPKNMGNRLIWAETAIKFHDFNSAEQAFSGLDEKTRQSVTYQKLCGAVAWGLGSNSVAEAYYREAQRLEPTNAAIQFNLATIEMTSTNREIASAARASLEQLTANPDYRIAALRHLMGDAAAHKSYVTAMNDAAEIATRPDASVEDRIDYLELLRVANGTNFSSWLATQKQEATHSPVEAFALGRWMITSENPATAIKWLRSLPESVQTNQPVPLVMSDCEIDLKDWSGLLTLVQKQDWAEANCFRLALMSLAQHSLNDDSASQTSWRRAMHLATHRLDHLVRLSQVTAAWGWSEQNEEVLSDIVSEFPKERWAVDALSSRLYAAGNTRELASILSKVYESDTTDPKSQNNFASVCLLLKSDMETAHKLAREAYDSAPQNPFYASTYAYSLLLQKKQDEAVKVLSSLKPENLQVPAVAAYYGVVEVESGHKELAKAALERAASAKLLPEENEMVRAAQAQL
jgi:predicted Zn-dependent protease